VIFSFGFTGSSTDDFGSELPRRLNGTAAMPRTLMTRVSSLLAQCAQHDNESLWRANSIS
jgi:hypothetical protein